MILGKLQLIGVGVAFATLLGTFTWFYFEGREEARQECLEEQAEIMKEWQKAIEEADVKNQKLAEDLAKKEAALSEASKARTKRIIKYVESDPNSDTIIFDADWLSILNSAQKGINTEGK